jgi:hypothetical protein
LWSGVQCACGTFFLSEVPTKLHEGAKVTGVSHRMAEFSLSLKDVTVMFQVSKGTWSVLTVLRHEWEGRTALKKARTERPVPLQ